MIMSVISFTMPFGLSWCWTDFSTFNHEMSLLSALAFFTFQFIVALWFARLFIRKQRADSYSTNSYSTKAQYALSAVILMIAIELPVFLSTPNEGLMDLILGTDPKLLDILERVPEIRQGPQTPLLLRNRHIHFIPWLIQTEIHEFQSIPYQRINVEVGDCANKLEGCHVPDMNDTIALDVFPPFHDSPYNKGFNKSSPVILVAPGIRCSSQDMPGNAVIRKAYGAGLRSIVVNRRGLVHPLKSPRMNILGDDDDLEQIYFYVKRELVAPDCPFFLYGISAGTAHSFSALSKWDKRLTDTPERETPVFVASVDLLPGYDTSRVMTHERFPWPYNDFFTAALKDHFVLQNEELLRKHDSDAVDKMLKAKNLQELVDAGVVFAGYTDTTSYYADTNPVNELRNFKTPKFVINAADDPLCNIQNLYDQSPHPQHEGKTYADMIRESEGGIVAVTYSGSHAPFTCTRNRWLPFEKDPLTGGWMFHNWADEVTIKFFLAALDVYGDK